jgi:hypothetical protein
MKKWLGPFRISLVSQTLFIFSKKRRNEETKMRPRLSRTPPGQGQPHKIAVLWAMAQKHEFV